VVPFPDLDGRWQVSTEGGRFPRWSPEGDRLYFWKSGNLMTASLQVSGGTPRFGAPELVFDLGTSPQFSTYGVSPDGDRFLVLLADESMGPPKLSLFLNWKEELESR